MDAARVMDPEVAEVLAGIPTGTLDLDNLPALRKATEAMFVFERSDAVEYMDHEVAGVGGPIVRVYTPKREATELRPCVYWIHGEGYLVGTYTMNDDLLQQ